MTSWPASAGELIDSQRALAATVTERGDAGPAGTWHTGVPHLHPAIGACVVVFPRGQTGAGGRGDSAWAAAAVLRRGRVLAHATVTGEAAGPYIPGLLALREGPCLEAAVRALSVAPDVLLVDATGADHPRRAGLALQLGAVTGLATVGVTHRPLLAAGRVAARGARRTLTAVTRRCVRRRVGADARGRAPGRGARRVANDARCRGRGRAVVHACSSHARAVASRTPAGAPCARKPLALVSSSSRADARIKTHGRSSARLLPMLGSSVCRN